MPYIKLSSSNQNLELYYELHGSGEIKILLIMGYLADAAAWYRQTGFFAEKPSYQCASFDNRGFSRSSSPLTLHYSTTQMAKDTIALIDHLQWHQCHVVGISMGGMIALELALLAPARILSLTLLATHAGGLAGRAPFAGIRHMIRSILLSDEDSLIENAMAMLYGTRALGDPEKRKELYDYHVERVRKRIKPTLIGFIGQTTAVYRHYVSYADLLKIRYSPFECLIMVGTEDLLVREANSYMLRRILGCRLVKLDNAGHGLQGECATEINQELFKLFESIRRKETSKKSKRSVPEEYVTEIKALEQCCQHRSHCLVYDVVGFLQGLLFGMILYFLFPLVRSTTLQLTLQSVILFGCVNGIRRAVKCVYHAFHARRYVLEHRLQLDRVAYHGGIGVALPEEPKNGIPDGCGFEFPIIPLILIANLISLVYWTRSYEQTSS
ncbi:unnamed protein product [Rotaria magnacalcarata]|uniref:AB hydrolase-1 domain-containing protein n=1 Tax=Rotaria magnacalcarata TaxID=392030 RepID=A0A815DMF4_9BILA|nr:unnamed protein product [Rotaria magnacalcarata]CAF1596463.1 unnamed protein product [Rotaria magnacalcarata]CAF2128534.1 unnamed protein product [Rotaria magnacalcarata]CAF3769893.1 unnamed protein product [Rotaria magnacalcarata]CAF3822501.1 unnamed protein product [Rotaria magnacalcarata]